nr:MAG TPA: hypothetical protein [Caudoviricetes sp.]
MHINAPFDTLFTRLLLILSVVLRLRSGQFWALKKHLDFSKCLVSFYESFFYKFSEVHCFTYFRV